MQYDEIFLRKLDVYPHRVVYAKVTALDWEENPLEQIEGRISNGGSISLDGSSSVRRACSFSLLSDEVDIHDFYWGYKTKIKVAIGLENFIDSSYPDIIWFEQGVFVITSFSCQLSTNGYTISISAKDKMCLLNGDVGGTMTAQTQFDCIEEETELGEWAITKYPIKDIIRNSLHQYAGEPFHNIVINDLDDMGLELLEYRYDVPMYLFRDSEDGDTYTQGVIGGDKECWINNGNTKTTISDSDIIYDSLVSTAETEKEKSTEVWLDEEGEVRVCIAKISYGETAGYRLTDMIYPSDLILSIGDALTSLYDKLVTMLGDFEYFYDTDGRFIFQKKKTSVNTVWTQLVSNDADTYVDDTLEESAYVFSGTNLFTAVSNSPTLNNLRNDFSVWGTRSSSSGSANLMVHARYAIDEKPVYYKTYEDDKVFYTDNLPSNISIGDNWKKVDWREIIYQMAKDYDKYNREDDYSLKIAENGRIVENGTVLARFYSSGRTGYEIYYIDLQGFWRQLYYPKEDWEKDRAVIEDKITASAEVETLKSYYESSLLSFEASYGSEYTDMYREDFWNINVYEAPQLLNYWLEFLDGGELAQYSVKNIGPRSKAVNDSTIKAIYYRDTPSIIFVEADEERDKSKSGYRYFQANNIESMFSISSQGKSAKDEIDSLIYNYSYAQESISISAIPIYYLQPNSRITINDDKTGISGDYIVSKVTLPLTYNGTMTLSATKAPERLL